MPIPHLPYSSVDEHLREELAHARILLVGAAVRARSIRRAAALLDAVGDPGVDAVTADAAFDAALSGRRLGDVDDEARVRRAEQAAAANRARIDARVVATLASADAPALPFLTLASSLRLSVTERQTLWMLAAVELDAETRELGRRIANGMRLYGDAELLSAAIHVGDDVGRLFPELTGQANLIRFRLIDPVGGGDEPAPFLTRPLILAQRVLDLMHGRYALDPELATIALLSSPTPRAESPIGLDEELSRLSGLLGDALDSVEQGRVPPTLLLAGPEGAGKRLLAELAATQHGLRLLFIDVPAVADDRRGAARLAAALCREARLFDALPVLQRVDVLDDAGRSRAALGALEAAFVEDEVPMLATMSSREARTPPLQKGVVRVDVGSPDEAEREALWTRTLAGTGLERAPDLDVASLAARYPVTGGMVARAGVSGAAIARARGSTTIRERDLHEALRDIVDDKLSTVGTRVTRTQTWEDLVVPAETMEGLRELLARLKNRRTVYEDWGFRRKLSTGLGVSALFAGPPGTGKTMVASLLARELGLDLYQIDLSRMVSKYIGETEKNLERVFEAAETGHSVLLFDEADSLFGKRTEVKSSNDRYANLEVNYLLQRMERFDGISILTTNLESSMDAAFKRRLSFRLDFQFPEVPEREKLWRSMIPGDTPTDGEIQVAALAKDYQMAGGNIRNAVLRAAFLAAAEGRHLSSAHLLKGADLEYAAMGKVFAGRRR